MSAFIVSNEHIRALVDAALGAARHRGSSCFSWYWGAKRRELWFENADAVGAMLVAENYRSVSYRYREAGTAPAYAHRIFPTRQDSPVEVLKAIACYEYQACEAPDWEASEAHAFCAALRSAWISLLPGWEQAAWGIEEPGGGEAARVQS